MSLSHRTSCHTSSVGASKRTHISQAKSSMANAPALNGVICGKLAYAFVKDKDLCQVYIKLTDPELQKLFMNNWYQETYGQLPPELSRTSFFSGTQTAQPGIYTGQ
ncbi:hypothetical protein JVT61DRAFT_9942 [Boletus reticuloceps]|uniref:Uncharacterized protein n=1 Tax=Boletus reticuloceps TaxID=495285 RepID=A0A8I3A5J9_9AGAM|nr:hypothetical protein JVT61DRAFT_9942 [Boletus reticuloceps]